MTKLRQLCHTLYPWYSTAGYTMFLTLSWEMMECMRNAVGYDDTHIDDMLHLTQGTAQSISNSMIVLRKDFIFRFYYLPAVF